MTQWIRNFNKDRMGITKKHGERVGIVLYTMEVHDDAIRSLGLIPLEDRIWHEWKIKVKQSVDEYMCSDCTVKFDPYSLTVTENTCGEHEISEVVFE